MKAPVLGRSPIIKVTEIDRDEEQGIYTFMATDKNNTSYQVIVQTVIWWFKLRK